MSWDAKCICKAILGNEFENQICLLKFPFHKSVPSDEKTWKEAFVEEYQDKKKYIHIYKRVKEAWDVIKNTMDQVDPAITSSLIGCSALFVKNFLIDYTFF